MTPDRASDARWMRSAIALGERNAGLTGANPSVGALVVKDGVVLGAGATQPGGAVHAEAVALDQAGEAARGATLYVTLEPCAYRSAGGAPCADLAHRAGIARVVIACEDPNPRIAGRSILRLRAQGLFVDLGVEAAAAGRSLAGHLTRTRQGRPFLVAKQAISSDGCIAAAGHRPVAITGPASNAQVHLLRARADAILVGIGTVLADDPSLTCRLPGLAHRSPLRVVLDRRLELPLASRLAATARETPVLVVSDPEPDRARRAALDARGVRVLAAEGLADALMSLAAEGVQTVLAEPGARLARALHEADLIDRYEIFEAPSAIGAGGIAAMHGLAVESVLNSSRYALHDVRRHGADVRLIYDRRPS